MKPAIEHLDVKVEELKQALERSRQAPLEEPDYRKLEAAVNTLDYLTELVADKDTTIRHLRQLLLGVSTEKTRDVLQKAGAGSTGAATEKETNNENGSRQGDPQPGHGRNGAEAFHGARKVDIAHQKLTHGDRCPDCEQGNVYGQKDPKVLVRIVGQAPLAATVYTLERLRCGACG